MKRVRLTTVLVVVATLICSSALAGQGSPWAHDGGLMLRLTGGFGGGSTQISGSVNELEISGSQGEFTFAIGGMVAENLAIHGTLFAFSMVDPEFKLNGTSLGDGSGTVTMSAFGGGVTYWVMPMNLYVSGSAGFGMLEVDPDSGPSGSSDTGFAMELAVGKEWFVSDSWGLGVGGGLTWHTIPDGEVPEDWSGASFSIRFTATYN